MAVRKDLEVWRMSIFRIKVFVYFQFVTSWAVALIVFVCIFDDYFQSE